MRLFSYLLALSFGLLPCYSLAVSSEWKNAEQSHSAVRLIASSYKKSEPANLGLQYHIKDGWKIYWRTPGDSGAPMKLDWKKSRNIKEVKLYWPFPKRSIEEGIETFGYKSNMVFPIEVTPGDRAKPIDANLDLEYTICKEICLVEKASISLNIPADSEDEKLIEFIDFHKKLVPQSNGTYGLKIESAELTKDGNLKVTATNNEIFDEIPELFIEGNPGFKYHSPSTKYISGKKGIIFTYKIKALAEKPTPLDEDIILTLVYRNNTAIERSVKLSLESEDKKKLK